MAEQIDTFPWIALGIDHKTHEVLVAGVGPNEERCIPMLNRIKDRTKVRRVFRTDKINDVHRWLKHNKVPNALRILYGIFSGLKHDGWH